MKRKIIAIILEIVPLVSAVTFYPLIIADLDSGFIRAVITAAVILSFLGVAFFILGRLLAKGSRAVLILGILDCLATVWVIGFYIFVFIAMAM